SALLFLVGHLGSAHAAPPLAQQAPAALTAKRAKAGKDILVQQRGIASWYGSHWQGRRTASGARFNDQALTCAHRWLPFATTARVTNLKTGKSVDVVVNDRGPYHAGRIIDLSARAAKTIGMKKAGIAPVLVQAVVAGKPAAARVAALW
ncbi:MAG: septal ring lytic transglycosylase RlpA family protein, partial [Stellaceae bacterium]